MLCFLRVSRSVDANPKLPSINSSVFCGLLTPARFTTKSQPLQYSSKSDLSVSISNSQISRSQGKFVVLFLPSLIVLRVATRFLPTKPLAPVTNIFIYYLPQFASSFCIYESDKSFSLTCSTVHKSVLFELNSVRVFLSLSPSLKYLS